MQKTIPLVALAAVLFFTAGLAQATDLTTASSPMISMGSPAVSAANWTLAANPTYTEDNLAIRLRAFRTSSPVTDTTISRVNYNITDAYEGMPTYCTAQNPLGGPMTTGGMAALSLTNTSLTTSTTIDYIGNTNNGTGLSQESIAVQASTEQICLTCELLAGNSFFANDAFDVTTTAGGQPGLPRTAKISQRGTQYLKIPSLAAALRQSFGSDNLAASSVHRL